MTVVEKLFIDMVMKCINDKKIEKYELTPQQMEELLELASQQQLLAMVYDDLSRAGMTGQLNKEDAQKWQKKAIGQVFRQIAQNNELLNMIEESQKNGYDPIVVKGIVCRNLYPIPQVRCSVDEDILIRKEEAEYYHEFLLSQGLKLDDEKSDIHKDFEVSYHKKGSPTYIEVHKSLFDPEAKGYSNLNDYFTEEVFDRSTKVLIEDIYVRTLGHTDHLLFLIFHAYKHFIYSGVGIRPICDIGMYGNRYCKEIDWGYIRRCLEESHTFYFVRGLFHIIREYLITEGELYQYIRDWQIEEVSTEELLKDSLEAGALGNASTERLNTANMTLKAVEGEDKHYLLATLFPPIRKIRKRYVYLDKMPYLLPIAWVDRIIHYLYGSFTRKKGNASESVKLGKERIQLLKNYRIVS